MPVSLSRRAGAEFIGTFWLAEAAARSGMAGLAASVKLTFLIPVVAIAVGVALFSGRGRRLTTAWVLGLSTLVAGGYWYLRAAIQSATTIVTRSRATDSTTSQSCASPAVMRLSIMNGLTKGTWDRTVSAPDRMSSRPVEA